MEVVPTTALTVLPTLPAADTAAAGDFLSLLAQLIGPNPLSAEDPMADNATEHADRAEAPAPTTIVTSLAPSWPLDVAAVLLPPTAPSGSAFPSVPMAATEQASVPPAQPPVAPAGTAPLAWPEPTLPKEPAASAALTPAPTASIVAAAEPDATLPSQDKPAPDAIIPAGREDTREPGFSLGQRLVPASPPDGPDPPPGHIETTRNEQPTPSSTELAGTSRGAALPTAAPVQHVDTSAPSDAIAPLAAEVAEAGQQLPVEETRRERQPKRQPAQVPAIDDAPAATSPPPPPSSIPAVGVPPIALSVSATQDRAPGTKSRAIGDDDLTSRPPPHGTTAEPRQALADVVATPMAFGTPASGEQRVALPPAARATQAVPWPARQVAPFVAALALGNESRLSLILEPAELGRVEVAIERSGNDTHVSLRAERADTLVLLQRDRAELERALSSAGSGDGSASLSFSLGSGHAGQQERRRDQERSASGYSAPPPAHLAERATVSRSLLDLAV